MGGLDPATRTAAIAAMLIVAAALGSASEAKDGATRGSGRLAVVTTKYELALMKPDGTGMRKLTRSLPGIHSLSLSPDGTRVAFVRDTAGMYLANPAIYVIHADGSGMHVAARGRRQRWSPHGRRLVLVEKGALDRHSPSARPPAPGRIVLIDVASGRRHVIGRGETPAWSPDGKQLAFLRYRYLRDHGWTEEASTLLTMQADGSHVHVLRRAFAGQVLYTPNWSPDGRTIAVHAQLGESNELWLIDAKSGASTLLASSVSGSGQWSPDGNHVAFFTYNEGLAVVDVKSRQVNVWAVARSSSERLTDLRWSPNGRQLAFEKCNDDAETCSVYTIKANAPPRRIASTVDGFGDEFDWGRS